MNKKKPLSQVRSIEDSMLNHITKEKTIQKGSILDNLMNFARLFILV